MGLYQQAIRPSATERHPIRMKVSAGERKRAAGVLLVEKFVDRRIHGFVERLSCVADEFHVRLRLEHLNEVLEAVLVLERDNVLGPPGYDDVYLSHRLPIGICRRLVKGRILSYREIVRPRNTAWAGVRECPLKC